MGRVKKISIENYLVRWLLVVIMSLTVLFLVAIHILSNVAIEYDIRSELRREAHAVSRNMKLSGDAVIWNNDGSEDESAITIQVLDSNGAVLHSDAKTDVPETDQKQRETEGTRDQKEDFTKKVGLRSLRVDGKSYYVMDFPRVLKDGAYEKKVVIRAIVRKSEITSKYQVFRRVTYLSIPLMIFVVLAGGGVFARRITRPLKEMQKVAEAAGQEQNGARRMEYTGPFEEIAVLTNANNRMMARLEETLENQKQFTSDVAHELRTPVAVMMAQCQFARENMDSKEDLQGAIQVLERQSRKMSHIISQLLKLSRLDQDRIPLELECVNIGEIVESVCEDEQEKAGDTCEICAKIQEMNGNVDVYLITILIHNLISNAVKYSPEGSKIFVETQETAGEIRVQVRDQGEGIAKEDLNYIFSRFYRGDKSRNKEGFGLGLPLAMKIAQKHGGTILAESVFGEGSTFTMVLPKERKR